jgi:hypothetical protein
VEIKNCIWQQTMADTAGQAVSFGHTKKTTKQNNKNPDSCLRQTWKIR